MSSAGHQAGYFLKMQRDIQMHFEIANSPEYKTAAGGFPTMFPTMKTTTRYRFWWALRTQPP